MNKKLISFSLLAISISLSAQNPFLPPTAFIPDGEPDVFEYKGEKRLFIYGSKDERITAYCGYGHDVWSAPINDLTKWTNHGEAFNIKQVQKIGYGKVDEQHFGAPDCVYNPILKKYFLYTFLGKPYKLDGTEGPDINTPGIIKGFEGYGPKCVVAESDSPAGPFTNPRMCDWPAVNNAGTFDPSVLVTPQKDGTIRVFAFWGMRKGDCWAEIDPNDMRTIINEKTRKPDIKAWYRTLNNPELNNYRTVFEASSIKQVAEDKFVFICSTNEFISALSYFYSNSPEGPWKYGGIIIENKTGWSGGNNHGSIVKVGEQWYVVYHRKTCNSYNRQAMIEPIDLRIEGDKVIISQVEMTSQGIHKDGLNPLHKYYAGTISNLTKGVYIAGDRREKDGFNPVVIAGKEPMIGWKYFNFDKMDKKNKAKLKINIKPKQKNCSIKVYVGEPGKVNEKDKYTYINQVNIKNKNDDKFYDVIIPMNKLDKLNIKGKQALFLSFESENDKEICELKSIEFLNK